MLEKITVRKKELIPLGIAVIMLLRYLIETLMLNFGQEGSTTIGTYVPINSAILGAIGIILTIIMICLRLRLWKFSFALMLLVSFTGVLSFQNVSYSFIFFGIPINMIPFLLLGFHLTLNPDIITYFNKN